MNDGSKSSDRKDIKHVRKLQEKSILKREKIN
jgi:hypothetical protein